jgi:hypothetical protein
MAKEDKKKKSKINPMKQDRTPRNIPDQSEKIDAKDIDQTYYDMAPKTEAQRMGAARRNREITQDAYFESLKWPSKDNQERASRSARAASAEEKIAAQQAGYQYNPATDSMDFEGNVKQYRKGGMAMKEKGTGEVYASKKAMMKHEKKESHSMERSEYRKGGAVMCRGGGLVTRKRPTKVC